MKRLAMGLFKLNWFIHMHTFLFRKMEVMFIESVTVYDPMLDFDCFIAQ